MYRARVTGFLRDFLDKIRLFERVVPPGICYQCQCDDGCFGPEKTSQSAARADCPCDCDDVVRVSCTGDRVR